MHMFKTRWRHLLLAGTTALAFSHVQAALLGRDIHGHAVASSDAGAVFLYDTDLNITWLRDAGAGFGTPYDATNLTPTDGFMTWYAALAFADTLVVGQFDDWRLPKAPPADPTCSFLTNAGPPYGELDFGLHCTGSELGHLRYLELGNGDGALTHTGEFQNMLGFGYWSSQTFAPSPGNAIDINFATGFQGAGPKDGGNLALVVRDGDVLAAPEPATGLLALLGLAVMARRARRRA